ncbi:MAG: septation protein spoVG [Candidatus Omnitrophica bacterium]|nr:septation protein spoVG [Candidatus Omnitrophota bacterium]
MEKDTELKVVRLYRYEGDSKVKAFCDVAIGDFIVKGLRLVQGKDGLFLSMPQEKSKDGKWYDTFLPLTKEARQNLSEIVLAAYQE